MNTDHLRRYLWVPIVVSAILLLAVATFDSSGPATDEERIQQLSASYACPVCAGQSVSESNAPVAATIRRFIANEVRAGATDTEIRDQLVASYDSKVLLTPPSDGISSLIWILPVVVLFGGTAALSLALTRKRGGSRDVTDEDEDLVAKARTSLGS